MGHIYVFLIVTAFNDKNTMFHVTKYCYFYYTTICRHVILISTWCFFISSFFLFPHCSRAISYTSLLVTSERKDIFRVEHFLAFAIFSSTKVLTLEVFVHTWQQFQSHKFEFLLSPFLLYVLQSLQFRQSQGHAPLFVEVIYSLIIICVRFRTFTL